MTLSLASTNATLTFASVAPAVPATGWTTNLSFVAVPVLMTNVVLDWHQPGLRPVVQAFNGYVPVLSTLRSLKFEDPDDAVTGVVPERTALDGPESIAMAIGFVVAAVVIVLPSESMTSTERSLPLTPEARMAVLRMAPVSGG